MVAFNPDYLSAGVDAVAADEVVIETLDALKPAVMRAGDATDFLYLLMPVRVAVAADSPVTRAGRLCASPTSATTPPADARARRPGLTGRHGDNGQGKTNLVEALAWLATLESFRGAPTEALVRAGADRAVLRAEVVHDDGRAGAAEAELPADRAPPGAGQPAAPAAGRDLLGVMQVSVFSPDDLALVKGGPGERRRFLDTTLVALHRKHDSLRVDLERILRQRNTLLKQAGGRLTPEIELTLDVWDAKLTTTGEALGARPRRAGDRAGAVGRQGLRRHRRRSDRGAPALRAAVAGAPGWPPPCAASRTEDLRRQLTLVGPAPRRPRRRARRPAGAHARVAGRAAVRWPSRCAWPPTSP